MFNKMNIKELKKINKKVEEIMELAWKFKNNKLTEKELKGIVEAFIKNNLKL